MSSGALVFAVVIVVVIFVAIIYYYFVYLNPLSDIIPFPAVFAPATVILPALPVSGLKYFIKNNLTQGYLTVSQGAILCNGSTNNPTAVWMVNAVGSSSLIINVSLNGSIGYNESSINGAVTIVTPIDPTKLFNIVATGNPTVNAGIVINSVYLRCVANVNLILGSLVITPGISLLAFVSFAGGTIPANCIFTFTQTQ